MIITTNKIAELAEEAAKIAKNATENWGDTQGTNRGNFAAEIFKALYERAKSE